MSLLLIALLADPAAPSPELYPADRPIVVPVWTRIGDFSPTLRSVEAAAFSPDGRTCASGAKFDASVMMWRVADGHLLWERAHESEVECVAFSPDGRYLATGGEDFTARIWEAATGEPVRTIALPRGLDGIAWSHDGRTLAGGDEDGTMHLIATVGEPDSWAVRQTIATGDTINSIAFTRDDARIAVAGNVQETDADGRHYLGFARLFDVATGDTLVDYGPIGHVVKAGTTMRTGSLKSIRFSRDESLVACGGFGKSAYVFETETGALVREMAGGHRIEAIAFTPDGHYLVTGGHAAHLTFYRTGDWSTAHEQPCVRCEYIDFTRDGRLMLTSHEDSGLLHLWLLASDLQRNFDGSYQRLANEQLTNRDLEQPSKRRTED